MFNDYMLEIGSHLSTIRELHEFGAQRAEQLGRDSVYDFSIGNPSVPVPEGVREAILALACDKDSVAVHSYTTSQGSKEARSAIAKGIKSRFGTDISEDLIYMTCGASAGLAISINALCEAGDEFVLCAPYFPEYAVYVRSAGGKSVTVPFEPNFDIDLAALESVVTPRTKAVVINSPNNPSGKVYSRELIMKLSRILTRKSEEIGRPIFVIADEPYRELVYGDAEVPYMMNFYPHCLVCYSYSKTLSLPGERIGYIAVSPDAYKAHELYSAILGAGRALGYVCAPSLFQKVVAMCEGQKPDIQTYRENGSLLYNGLTEIGYECVHPDGAFYLFVKAPGGDSKEFSSRARNLGVLIVPGDDFAACGYCRVAYCVEKSVIQRALPLFKEIFESYSL